MAARARSRAGEGKAEAEDEEVDRKVVEQETLTMHPPSTLAMELLRSTQATLPQTLRALAVPLTTAMQPQPQRITMARLPWTQDTELLLDRALRLLLL